ncbi:MAG: hypothetical protein AAB535_01915 [Patescibacteria group bacterium]
MAIIDRKEKTYVNLNDAEVQALAEVGKAAQKLRGGGLSLTEEDIEKTKLASKHLSDYLSITGKLM